MYTFIKYWRGRQVCHPFHLCILSTGIVLTTIFYSPALSWLLLGMSEALILVISLLWINGQFPEIVHERNMTPGHDDNPFNTGHRHGRDVKRHELRLIL